MASARALVPESETRRGRRARGDTDEAAAIATDNRVWMQPRSPKGGREIGDVPWAEKRPLGALRMRSLGKIFDGQSEGRF
jgi:hypothetical protein